MTTVRESTFEDFYFQNYRMFRDANGSTIPVATGPDFLGYLVYDTLTKKILQVRLCQVQDGHLQERLNFIWRFFSKVKTSELCPKIRCFGLFESSCFCIADLPMGEPIRHFYNRNGAIPAETAVLLIRSFVRSLLKHKPEFYQQIAIHPASIWLCRSSGHPRIELGEISEVTQEEPEKHNIHLCIDLLKYLTDHPEGHANFQKLLQSLAKAQNLETVETLLNVFADQNPAANYWMGYNDPASILERVRTGGPNSGEDRTSLLIETAKKSFWPLLIGVSVCIVSFMVYLITLLQVPVISEDARVPVPVVVRTSEVPAKHLPAQSAAPITPKPTPKSDPVRSPSRPLPPVVQSNSPVNRMPGEVSPLLKELLSDTGDLFEEISRKQISEWLIFDDGGEKNNRAYRFSDEDDKRLAILQLKKASSEARVEHRFFDSAKIEVELLKIAPDSLESRIRLHDDLTIIRQNIKSLTLSEHEEEILSEAATQNSLAGEILSNYREVRPAWSSHR